MNIFTVHSRFIQKNNNNDNTTTFNQMNRHNKSGANNVRGIFVREDKLMEELLFAPTTLILRELLSIHT